MTHPTNPTAVKVKRDGPRGWHWIAADHFDPDVHELADEDDTAKPARKPRGKAVQ